MENLNDKTKTDFIKKFIQKQIWKFKLMVGAITRESNRKPKGW